MEVSSKNLVYNKGEKTFIGEASIVRIPDEDERAEIVIVSHKTGEKRKFTYDCTDRDGEGEIYGWHFVGPDGMKLLVVN